MQFEDLEEEKVAEDQGKNTRRKLRRRKNKEIKWIYTTPTGFPGRINGTLNRFLQRHGMERRRKVVQTRAKVRSY